VTQYNAETGLPYSPSTYIIILWQVILGAVAGVYNQHLLKSSDSSLHANNVFLYAGGTLINLLAHFAIWAFKFEEPGLFSGYNSYGAVLVVANNVLLGLVISAVYKCE
jgi:hypothetical protein